jgi:hypothetical protein
LCGDQSHLLDRYSFYLYSTVQYTGSERSIAGKRGGSVQDFGENLCDIVGRVFSEVPFWNFAEYGILYGIYFISRNSAKFFTVQYRGIPYRFVYTEFRIPSKENTIIEPITKIFETFTVFRIFVKLLELKSDSLLHDAVGSKISPLHYAAGGGKSRRCILCYAAGSQIFPLHCDSLLHLAVGSQILPLHFGAWSQILPLHDATGTQVLLLHDAAGSQILPPHYAARSKA